MSEHESPFDEDVYQAWHAIAFDKLGLKGSQLREMWRRLYDSHFVNGVAQVDIMSSGLITLKGINFALTDQHYEEAERLCRIHFSHPDIRNDDSVHTSEHWTKLGLAMILQGRFDEGCRFLLEYPEELRSKTGYRSVLRNDLLVALHMMGAVSPCDNQIRELATQVIQMFEGMSRIASGAKRARTNGDLIDALELARAKACDRLEKNRLR